MTVPMDGPDPIEERGKELARLIMQDLALNQSIQDETCNDEIYEALRGNVQLMLKTHSSFFSRMAATITVRNYIEFISVAKQLFEAADDEEPIVTWGRIVSLFAFSVKFAQVNRSDVEIVANIEASLRTFVSQYIVPFVREQPEGWGGIVEDLLPPPSDLGMNNMLRCIGVFIGVAAAVVAVKKLLT